MDTKKVDLKQIKDQTLPKMALRNKKLWADVDSIYEKEILICGDTGCKSSKSDVLEENFRNELASRDLEDKIGVRRVGCFGLCQAGPIAVVYPGQKFYAYLKPEDAATIVEKDIVGGQTVESLIYPEALEGDALKGLYEVEFYQKQTKVVTGNCGVIDPESIDEYIAVDGYVALTKAITEMTPQEVVDEVVASGLRGRGGGGFPTGIKWQSTKDSAGDVKYVVLNADEGDPGAFMDRSILEGDPYAIVEALTIAGYAVGANQGYIYIRAEYPSAVHKLEHAIEMARSYNLIGNDILGSGFNFELDIRLGAGAFVCGEEMALIESIEGKRGIPRNKPPYPAQVGLFGKPTLINNVETMGNIPRIIRNGSDWFNSIGVEKNPGTKVFTLGGDIVRSGIIEVPMGTTLREIVEEIGGGIRGGKKFKAVQTGGPSGGVITSDHVDVQITYESLQELGSMMGSGGMIVMDEDTCMVDIAKFYLDFTVDESCGKCTPCREGTKRLWELLDDVTEGRGSMATLDELESLAKMVKSVSLCGLGQSAPNPILSTLNYYRDEYIAHVDDKRCPSGICKELTSFRINDNCTGCTLCARKCPVDCISGERKEKHVIDQDECIKCGACFDACNFNAVERG